MRRTYLYLYLKFAFLSYANTRAKSSLIWCLGSFLDVDLAGRVLLWLVHSTVQVFHLVKKLGQVLTLRWLLLYHFELYIIKELL